MPSVSIGLQQINNLTNRRLGFRTITYGVVSHVKENFRVTISAVIFVRKSAFVPNVAKNQRSHGHHRRVVPVIQSPLLTNNPLLFPLPLLKTAQQKGLLYMLPVSIDRKSLHLGLSMLMMNGQLRYQRIEHKQ
jgi:hypothetical protein